jgi:YgiT-type zinc finger domain-containing protein
MREDIVASSWDLGKSAKPFTLFVPRKTNIWLSLPHIDLPQTNGHPTLDGDFRGMECLYCKAQMQHGTAPFTIDRNGYHISWDNIPAWVCDQCGEVMFEAREVDLIQEALTSLDRETATLVGQPVK